MDIPVLIEPVAGNGYHARGGGAFSFVTAEGATREEALRKLREVIVAKLHAGAEVVQLTIPPVDNPWVRMIGTLNPDDPLVQEWENIIQENRRKADADPNVL